MPADTKEPSGGVLRSRREAVKMEAAIQSAKLVFVCGALSFLVLGRLPVVGGLLRFFWILEHELLHGLAAILRGGRIVKMEIGLRDGSASTTRGGFIVRVFPYCVPLFCLTAIGISYALRVPFKNISTGVAGLFYGSFVIHHLRSIRAQPDIRRSCRPVAYPVIVTANGVVLMVLHVLLSR